MKIIPNQADGNRWPAGPRSGYTLVEMMFAVGIMVIMVMALFAAQLVGFRLGQLVDSKSGASDASRHAIQNLVTDIRSAKMWAIGNLTGTNFVQITNAAIQGTALQLDQTTIGSTIGSQFAIYYFTNAGNNNGILMCVKANSNWNPMVICSNLIVLPNDNLDLHFTAENYAGQEQTNNITNVNNYKNIIHVKLDFCQFQYPLTQVGTNGLYDYYKLEFRATPHLPE
jgi:Tfp pilus assembly protein PilW